MNIWEAIGAAALMASLAAPVIIDSLAQAGFFQRRDKDIKDLEKKIEELEKERK